MRTHRFHSTKLVRRIVPPAAQRSIGIAPISLIADDFVTRCSESHVSDSQSCCARQMAIFNAKGTHDQSNIDLGYRRRGAISAGCANGEIGSATAQSAGAQRDYELLSGTWQLTRAVVNGKSVPATVLRNTVLITDHNTFRFPKASGVGTHPAGRFTVNPDTRPKQLDSIAEGGPNAAQLTRGITRSSTQPTNAPTGGPPGGPRPTEFKSPPGSGRILQYCKKIGPVPSR